MPNRSTKVAKARIVSGDPSLAKHFGVSTRTIYQWRCAGMPCEDHGRYFDYDLDQVEPWVSSYRSEVNDPEEGGSLNRQLKEAKLRVELAEAARLERLEEQARGNILPLDDYQLFATETIQNARDQFLRLPKEMKSHLCPKCQGKLKELESLVLNILEQLSRLSDGPDQE